MTTSSEDEDALTWIPRVVRAKLDLAGIRIHLADWQRMCVAERRELVAMPCGTADEIATFRSRVLELATLLP